MKRTGRKQADTIVRLVCEESVILSRVVSVPYDPIYLKTKLFRYLGRLNCRKKLQCYS